MSDLVEVTKEFGLAYDVAGQAEKDMEEAKRKFYEALDERLSKRRLPRMKVVVKEDDHDVYLQRYYPAWRVVDSNDGMTEPGGGTAYLLERDPSKMKDTFVNPEDGMVYQRTTQTKPAALDVERLKQEDPELWRQSSVWPEPLHSIVYTLVSGDVSRVDEVLNDFKIEREPIPSNQWTKEQAARLQPYLVPGQIIVKTVKPRAATEEELGEAS